MVSFSVFQYSKFTPSTYSTSLYFDTSVQLLYTLLRPRPRSWSSSKIAYTTLVLCPSISPAISSKVTISGRITMSAWLLDRSRTRMSCALSCRHPCSALLGLFLYLLLILLFPQLFMCFSEQQCAVLCASTCCVPESRCRIGVTSWRHVGEVPHH